MAGDTRKGIEEHYENVINAQNCPAGFYNGIFRRYKNPVLTREHIPPFWKYDFNTDDNPFFMERMGVNAVFNSGAVYLNGKYYLIARVEGTDRKSFFAVAESDNPVQGFRFWDYPLILPDLYPEETNVYDMRVTVHEDGTYTAFFAARARRRERRTCLPHPPRRGSRGRRIW